MASFDDLDELIVANAHKVLDEGQLFVYCDGWHVWFETNDWTSPTLEFVTVATVPPSPPGHHLVEPMRRIGFAANQDGFEMEEPIVVGDPVNWIAATARRVFEDGLGLRPLQMLLGPWYHYNDLPGAPADDDPDAIGSRAWLLAQRERLGLPD